MLGFMLFREGVKLYISRQSNREGSRIKSKLVMGALALEPASGRVPGRVRLRDSESQRGQVVQPPAEGVRTNLVDTADSARRRSAGPRAGAGQLDRGDAGSCAPARSTLRELCSENRIAELRIRRRGAALRVPGGAVRRSSCIKAEASIGDGRTLAIGPCPGVDLAARAERDRPVHDASTTSSPRKTQVVPQSVSAVRFC